MVGSYRVAFPSLDIINRLHVYLKRGMLQIIEATR